MDDDWYAWTTGDVNEIQINDSNLFVASFGGLDKIINSGCDLLGCMDGNVSSWVLMATHEVQYDVSDRGGELPLLNLAGPDVTDAYIDFHPSSACKHLDKFFNGYYLKDYKVFVVSKDYRKLYSKFKKMGLSKKKGHGVMISLVFMATLFPVHVYGVLFSESGFVHLMCDGLMGFLWIQSGWFGHDSMENKSNRLAQILTENYVAGISIGWWHRNHIAQHIAVNSLEYDHDLQNIPMFAVSSKFFGSLTSKYYERKLNFNAITRFLVSYQHFTYYPGMCFARHKKFGQSFALLSSNKKVPNRGEEILGLLVFWIWYPWLVSCLPNWGERVMFVLASFTITGIQHVQFTLNRFSSSVYVGESSGNDGRFEKQTNGTLNITCLKFMDWFNGGLQFQIEHHGLPLCLMILPLS